MKILFTSERLNFRNFTEDDGPLIYELNSDPEVLKYLHELPTTKESATQVIRYIIIPQYQKYNYGRWAVHLKTTDEFVGWCGLKYRTDRGVTDLGYRFRQKFWGKGFATEAAMRCIDRGFKEIHLASLFAAAHVDNIASQKVLEKCGFQFISTERIDDCPAKTYELQNG